jgi:hypothetical protein
MMKRLLITVALTSCVAYAAHAADPGAKASEAWRDIKFIKHVLTPAERDLIVSAVKQNLKDPYSAQFGAMAAGVTGRGDICFCGQVNAKNSYGGYTGMSPFSGSFYPDGTKFYPDGTKMRVVILGSDKVMNMIVQGECRRVTEEAR